MSSKTLKIVNIWELRGITTPNLVYDAAYNGDVGIMKFFSNGDLVFLGKTISSSTVDSMINDSLIISSDRFVVTDGENSYVFIVTGNGTATVYASFGSVTTDGDEIYSAATQAGTVFEYDVKRPNIWIERNISQDYISIDSVYTGSRGNIIFYSNGNLAINGGIAPSKMITDYITAGDIIIYSDGFLIRPGSNYYLFISKGDGTATYYKSSSDLGASFDRESILDHNPESYPYTLE